MAQWGQGFQYPMQTGFNPQQQQQPQQPQQFQQGFQAGGLAPQPTGFPGQRLQPQPTGFPGQQQPQPTGFGMQQTGFQQQPGFQPLQAQPTGFQPNSFQRRAPPPVPPIPSQFSQQNVQPTGMLGAQNPSRFLSPSPGPLTAQPTGFAGAMQPLVPQMTGFIDPRLQMMSSTFLPANPSMPYNPAGAPQLQQQVGTSLQQSFQQHNQAQRGTAAPRVPWALSKAEKKSYDQIFRAWDTRGEGFISGQTALEVFGQSGLDKNDLAKIWALADADNRGKLNLAEFHVAMGLIYRKLNGNEIPDELPAELVPPSHRDLDTSVNFLKDILKNDTRARSPGNFDGPVSKLKERSFNSTSAPGAGGRQDATVYKHNDETPAGGFYQPRSRHVDRAAIRTTSESNSPASDLSDMKRQLENTAKMLDRNAEESAARTAEDEELEREMSDMRYRVKRLQEDLDYVSRGPRSTTKDEERRKLERQLMTLMHERIPELERRIQDREERKKRQEREWQRDRDRRNERFGRYDDRDRDDHYPSRYDDRDRDRDYRSYDRDRSGDRSRDRDERDKYRDLDRDRPYSRNRDRDYDRPRSPPAVRSPPPPPPAPSTSSINRPPPAPAPTATPAPALSKMTEEERRAHAKAEAQKRIAERMAALGLSPAPASTPKVDSSVEERLAKEKQEAEEKAKAAEREAEERERLRQLRLQGEKALKEGSSPTTPTTPSAPPATTVSAPAPAPPKATPPAPKPRAPAPPPPRKAPAPKPPVAARAPPAPAPPPPAPVPAAAPAEPEIDPEEEAFRAREAALRKAREERLERLRRMEEEEAEAARRLEEEYQARRKQFMSPPPAAPPAPTPPAPAPPVAAPAPPPPPPPPAPVTPPPAMSPPAAVSPPSDKAKTNPFSRMMQEGSTPSVTSPPPTTNGGTNPFFKPQVSSPPIAPPPPAAPPAPRAPSVPPPSKSPAPPAVKTSYQTAPDDDSDWDDPMEKDQDDDSSDDELDSSRDTRNKLAQQLFGSIMSPSRPQSAAPPQSARSESSTPAPPAPPPPPSAPPAPEASAFAAPPPPPPPAAPPAPGAPAPPAAPPAPSIAAPAPSGDRGALLDAIRGGARLRKAQTNDRSAAPVSGKVIGDAAPPPHVNAVARPPSPPSPPAAHSMPLMPTSSEAPSTESTRSNRESVGWFAGLAADHGVSSADRLESMAEEEEPEAPAPVPHIQVDETLAPAAQSDDAMQDIDTSTEYRVRSLYAYEGQRPEDLSFGENLILTAHPSKSGADWWYGTLVRDGKSGFFPKTYVDRVEAVKAKALYSYEGSNADELPFSEGDELNIIDRSDPDWWKTEQSGVVFIVPAAYLEAIDG